MDTKLIIIIALLALFAYWVMNQVPKEVTRREQRQIGGFSISGAGEP